MMDLIEKLREFNRKERYYLLKMATQNSFQIASDFRTTLDEKLGITVPQDAFCAMDYHLDWIYGSLFLTFKNNSEQPWSNDDCCIKGTQEDVDFLITFEDAPGHYCMIIVEAKGETNWSNSQLESKAKRLKNIYGKDGKKWPNVVPFFVICSPKDTRGLKTEPWPDWMKPNGQPIWIEMPMQDSSKKIVRCTEGGKADSKGKYWMLGQVSKS